MPRTQLKSRTQDRRWLNITQELAPGIWDTTLAPAIAPGRYDMQHREVRAGTPLRFVCRYARHRSDGNPNIGLAVRDRSKTQDLDRQSVLYNTGR